MPIPLPPSRWPFPPIGTLTDEEDLVAVGADLDPSTLVAAYRAGYFPMPIGRRRLGWFSPDPRGVLLPGNLRVSRSLRRSLRRFRFTVDRAFDEVILACGDPSREHGWIDHDIRRAYTALHHLGYAHSVETWDDQGLAGGLYGVQVGGLFAGESMFHRRTDASKAALVHLVELQGHRADPETSRVIDVQWQTPHLASLGVTTVSRNAYGRLLAAAIADPRSGLGLTWPATWRPWAQDRSHDRPLPSGSSSSIPDVTHFVALPPSPTIAILMSPASTTPTEPTTVNRAPDRPWMMRTYSGHSTAKASNELYRTNLAKGQTGLSIAFDLPTQTGYDPDDPKSRGEVGKVGVPVAHKGHMATLLDEIPVGSMNTSMTINAPAAWMLGLYIANAEDQGVPSVELRGTTQNDIVKEYLSRGTFIFPPDASRRLIVDMFAYCNAHVPKWNPMNVCSYHLQEAGATPVQEIAYSLANAIGVLDAVRESGQVTPEAFTDVVASVSFFVNSGIRFIEETCKMRAFTQMWDRITAERYGVTDPKARRFRYGVQVNSLGLTEAQPENNVQRIVLEALGVTLSRDARARSIQLPAWNEALGLPRPWDQQWSLRIQQVLAFETDLLEYDDIFAGSHVIEAKTRELVDAATAELDEVLELGGAFEAIDELKGRLVRSHAERLRRIERGETTIVGVNELTETAPSPLGGAESIQRVDPAVQDEMIADVQEWRERRDTAAVEAALDRLAAAARSGENVMPATIELAHAGGTTGEWAGRLREIFGEYRAPTGVAAASGAGGGSEGLRSIAARLANLAGGPPRFLVAKPGLDGHSNGAEQIAVAARDAGMEVIYQGIRMTPEEIVAAARDEDVDAVGISILSGSHLELVPDTIAMLRDEGVTAPVIVGGIIPEDDQDRLREAGAAAVFTPKDFEISRMISDVVDLALAHREG